jgi:hypothetical protein
MRTVIDLVPRSGRFATFVGASSLSGDELVQGYAAGFRPAAGRVAGEQVVARSGPVKPGSPTTHGQRRVEPIAAGRAAPAAASGQVIEHAAAWGLRAIGYPAPRNGADGMRRITISIDDELLATLVKTSQSPPLRRRARASAVPSVSRSWSIVPPVIIRMTPEIRS